MLVETQRENALKALLAGREALVIMEYDDGSKEVMNLWELLPEENARYLAAVPAIEKPEFAQAVQEMEGKKLSAREPQYATTEEVTAPVKAEVSLLPAKNSGISETDKKRIRELYNSGKSITEIAKETGVKYNAVWNQVKKQTGSVPLKAENNTDREKCKSCMYRDTKKGCDYISIVGHSRGCSVSNCTVYQEGERQAIRKPLTT